MNVTFNASVNLIPNQSSNLRAFATLFIQVGDNTAVAVNGFRVIEGAKGLFVAAPATKSSQPGEDGKYKYYDDVRFLEEKPEGVWQGPVEKAAKDAILEAYGAAIGQEARGDAAGAQADPPERSEQRPVRTVAKW